MGAGMATAFGAPPEVASTTAGLVDMGTGIEKGDAGGAMTKGMSTLGGVIPGQGGEVVSGLADSTGGIVDGAIAGDS